MRLIKTIHHLMVEGRREPFMQIELTYADEGTGEMELQGYEAFPLEDRGASISGRLEYKGLVSLQSAPIHRAANNVVRFPSGEGRA